MHGLAPSCQSCCFACLPAWVGPACQTALSQISRDASLDMTNRAARAKDSSQVPGSQRNEDQCLKRFCEECPAHTSSKVPTAPTSSYQCHLGFLISRATEEPAPIAELFFSPVRALARSGPNCGEIDFSAQHQEKFSFNADPSGSRGASSRAGAAQRSVTPSGRVKPRPFVL